MPPPIDKGKRKAPVNPLETPSSIDEIFASSSKPQPSNSTSSKPSKRPRPDNGTVPNGVAPVVGSKKKKKKRRVGTEDDQRADDEAELGQAQRDKAKGQSVKPVVETVLDPSVVKLKPDKEKDGKKRSKKDLEEDEAFRDSRGTRRKTEEGFLIYKEAELGINPEAGGTPLCPFDCDCCF